MLLLFDGFWRTSKCYVDMFGDIALVTQVDFDDDPGTSITNAAEEVAKSICDQFKIDYEKLIFIEHYKDSDWTKNYYKLVSFEIKNNQFTNPNWRNVSIEEISELIRKNLSVNEIDTFVVKEKDKLDRNYKDRLKFLEGICPHSHSILSDKENEETHCFACDKLLDK